MFKSPFAISKPEPWNRTSKIFLYFLPIAPRRSNSTKSLRMAHPTIAKLRKFSESNQCFWGFPPPWMRSKFSHVIFGKKKDDSPSKLEPPASDLNVSISMFGRAGSWLCIQIIDVYKAGGLACRGFSEFFSRSWMDSLCFLRIKICNRTKMR